MIKSLRKRFIIFSVMVISLVIIIAALIIYVGSDRTISETHTPIEHYFISLSLIIVIVFAGSWFLSKLAVKPIQNAWQKQLDFTADASHELRTPITVIQTNLDVVMDNSCDIIANQMKWLKNIEAENKRMARLVEDLLTLSRADTNQQVSEKETFMIDETLIDALAPFIPVAEKKGLSFNIDVQKNTAFYGDKKRITQLLVILVDNAFHYTKSGAVNVFLHKTEHELTLIVKDTGSGIAAEHANKIFDRFYRVTNTRGMHQDGSGLGLPIAKWIVTEHKGSISVESSLGKGSTFTVKLPDLQKY
jgi:signal transduction histidine kinase